MASTVAGAKTHSQDSEDSFESNFDRELAALNAEIDRLAASVVKPPPTVHVAKGMAASQAHQEAPAPKPAPAAAASALAVPSAPATPTGTDLADPKNFGLLPSMADLDRGDLAADQYRQRLSQQIVSAERILHTSGVPAAVWREWRIFEKTARERLQAQTESA